MPPKKTAKGAKPSKTIKATKALKAPKGKKVAKKEEAVIVEETKQDEGAVNSESIVQELKVKDTTIEKALDALSEWNKTQTEKSSKKDLFEDDDNDIPLFLQVTSRKYFSDSKLIKPKMLALPHPIHDLEDLKVCLFVKDGLFDEESNNKLETEQEDGQLKNLSLVVTVKDLKTKYQQYEARRQLLSQYDVFLTDASIANMIPKLLGKTFFKSSIFPLTITITDNENKLSMEKMIKNFNSALNSVGYMLPAGTNMNFRLGMLGQNLKHLQENVQTIVKFLQKYPIRAIQIKLKNSPSLPLYVTEKVYSEDDVLSESNAAEDAKKSSEEIELSIYAEGLKELGMNDEDAEVLFGKKKRSVSEISKDSESSSKKVKTN